MSSTKIRKRKEYYLEPIGRKRHQTFYIRSNIVPKYRGALTGQYRRLPLFKQIFEVMHLCRENGGYITKGEFVAILRRNISITNPTTEELNTFNTQIHEFRRWLGALSGMLVYVRHERIPAIHGMEWIYRPIKNKTEYKQIRKHIDRTEQGLHNRQKQNLELLSMTQKQIEKRIQEIAEELDLEAQGY